MKFAKCPYCGKHALMRKTICKSCWIKHLFKLSMALTLGKIKIPKGYQSLIDELQDLKRREKNE